MGSKVELGTRISGEVMHIRVTRAALYVVFHKTRRNKCKRVGKFILIIL